MAQHKPSPDVTLVERQEQVDEICARSRAEGCFAFDTEFVMEDRYESELCLIQVATESSVAIIDPFLELDVGPVWDLVCDNRVESVVHAGQEDLGLCVQHTGNLPRGIFDIQIAAGLAGYDYPLSLQKLVRAALHVRLHKAKTLTDWRRRPLTSAQLHYAAEDVSYLLPVRKKLLDQLAQAGRVAWARAEFERFEEISLYRRAEEEKLRRVKGAGALKGRRLAVLHELLTWRDQLAQVLNRPARTVVKDHLLVEIASADLSSFEEIRELRGLNLSNKNVHALCRVVRVALEMPRDQWPVPEQREVEAPREAALIALATALIRSYCLDHGLAHNLVASKRSIRELIHHRRLGRPPDPADVDMLTGWRGGTVGAMLDEVLSGRRSVRIESVDGEPVLRIVPVDGSS